MRIDIIKEATQNIIEASMKGKDEAKIDITDLFVTPEEEREVTVFLINGMGILSHVYIDNQTKRRMIHLGWSHIAWLFDED